MKEKTGLSAVTIALMLLVLAGNASGWWSPDWSHRARITIHNETNPDSVLDVPVMVVVPWLAGMAADFSDIRFIDDTDTDGLGYWIQGYAAAASCTCWVRVPKLPASGAASGYLYWDNPGVASASDPTEGFNFHDDFHTDPNQGGWTIHRCAGDTTKEAVWDPDSGVFCLTTLSNSAGVACFVDMDLTADNWVAEFDYWAGKPGASIYQRADGFVCMFYKDRAAYGRPDCGSGIGFVLSRDIPVAGYGLEFDSFRSAYQGQHVDPNRYHVGLMDSTYMTHLACTSDYRVADTAWHHVVLKYESGHVLALLDGDTVIDHTIDAPDQSHPGFGFGAGTGGLNAWHIIDNLVLRYTAGAYQSAIAVDIVAETLDVVVTGVVSPSGSIAVGSAVIPAVAVENRGNVAASCTAFCRILDAAKTEIFADEAGSDLGVGVSETLSFDEWQTVATGEYTCESWILADGEQSADTTKLRFSVVPGNSGWDEMASMPETSSGKTVKRGAWLAVDGDGMIYATKGYKTNDFYSYDPVADTWVELADVLPGTEGKLPQKGCKGISDGDNLIYMTKGYNTYGYWQYKIDADSWYQLIDVPEGPTRKKVKGGTDLVYVTIEDTGFVYMLKGYKTEFWRYNTRTGQWEERAAAPTGIKYKWDKGSWLVYDDDATIYAHKAKYYDRATYKHEFWKYDIPGDSWYVTPLSGMPLYGLHSGKIKKKKAKDGGTGAVYGDRIYALKGGNTQQFWMYDIAGDTWCEQDTVPTNGSTNKKKRVKYGADLVHWGGGIFFALKGNKTVEFWRYVIPTALAPRPERSGVMAGPSFDTRKSSFAITPNPLTGNVATLRYSLPKAGPALIHVFDVTGRSVVKREVPATRTGAVSLDIRSLSAGIYLVRLDTDGYTATQKLVVQK